MMRTSLPPSLVGALLLLRARTSTTSSPQSHVCLVLATALVRQGGIMLPMEKRTNRSGSFLAPKVKNWASIAAAARAPVSQPASSAAPAMPVSP